MFHIGKHMKKIKSEVKFLTENFSLWYKAVKLRWIWLLFISVKAIPTIISHFLAQLQLVQVSSL